VKLVVLNNIKLQKFGVRVHLILVKVGRFEDVLIIDVFIKDISAFGVKVLLELEDVLAESLLVVHARLRIVLADDAMSGLLFFERSPPWIEQVF
jgi:hypothetical protein